MITLVVLNETETTTHNYIATIELRYCIKKFSIEINKVSKDKIKLYLVLRKKQVIILIKKYLRIQKSTLYHFLINLYIFDILKDLTTGNGLI